MVGRVDGVTKEARSSPSPVPKRKQCWFSPPGSWSPPSPSPPPSLFPPNHHLPRFTAPQRHPSRPLIMFLLRLLYAGAAAVYTFVSSLASNALIPVQQFDIASTAPAVFFRQLLDLGIKAVPQAHVEPTPQASFFNSISAVPINGHSLFVQSPAMVPSVIVNTPTALSVQSTSSKVAFVPVQPQSVEDICLWLSAVPLTLTEVSPAKATSPVTGPSSSAPRTARRTSTPQPLRLVSFLIFVAAIGAMCTLIVQVYFSAPTDAAVVIVKKKRAHRGRRGGKREQARRELEAQAAAAQVQTTTIAQDTTTLAEASALVVDASTSDDASLSQDLVSTVEHASAAEADVPSSTFSISTPAPLAGSVDSPCHEASLDESGVTQITPDVLQEAPHTPDSSCDPRPSTPSSPPPPPSVTPLQLEATDPPSPSPSGSGTPCEAGPSSSTTDGAAPVEEARAPIPFKPRHRGGRKTKKGRARRRAAWEAQMLAAQEGQEEEGEGEGDE